MKVICSTAALCMKNGSPTVYHDVVEFPIDISYEVAKESKDNPAWGIKEAQVELKELKEQLGESCDKIFSISRYFYCVEDPSLNYGIMLRDNLARQYEEACMLT